MFFKSNYKQIKSPYFGFCEKNIYTGFFALSSSLLLFFGSVILQYLFITFSKKSNHLDLIHCSQLTTPLCRLSESSFQSNFHLKRSSIYLFFPSSTIFTVIIS